MKNQIPAQAKTPLVEKDLKLNLIKISGVIIPENPIPFFEDLYSFTEELVQKTSKFNLHVDLEYFNTSSARYFYDYLKKLIEICDLHLTWFYDSDDEDILESGQELEELCKIKFSFVEK
ncbi:MAG: DUF1987 domain-containing protein [Bacteroidales bacterium]|nr:DUF1987 domain-containing protein [Bacteroidales bacterium]MCK9499465.1 DUF1987 domain-containing protein [Bacteroidales bacterium]MDY0315850.1 SiaC family regulatory phosphoprotein [Bacteroidales bacterium]NLB86680.1 DUF1987 domain-containing protein [Bacteroidales bacterium]